MSADLLLVTALRSEYAAVQAAGNVRVLRSGMRAPDPSEWLPTAEQCAPRALGVLGVAGGLSPEVCPGDVIVATEVRDHDGRIVLRGAAPLAAELRARGMRVHCGPIASQRRIAGRADRARLRTSGALAVDMESAAIVRNWGARSPVAVARVVVDTTHAGVFHPATVPNGLKALLTLRRTVAGLKAWAELAAPRRVLLAGPRSFCAGVERAIDVVERALRIYPHPVYVRRQIVHNTHVIAELERRGAVFVDELSQVPDRTTVVFSAHGVAPAVRAEAARRGLQIVDGTCPLVTKVHTEATRFARWGYSVLLIGHAGHDEVEGTMGELPGRIQLVQTADEARQVQVADPTKVAYVTQTTLAAADVEQIVAVLRERFPEVRTSRTDDICFATTNRQDSVRAIADESDVVVVLGSANSSNSQRLVETAHGCGTRAVLVDDATQLRPGWLRDAHTVGITAGASAPPHLVDELVATLGELGPIDIVNREVTRERVHFALPKEVAE